MTPEVINNQKTSGNLNYRVIYVIIKILLVCFITIMACEEDDTTPPNEVRITHLDFRSATGRFEVVTQLPKPYPEYSDVTHFIPEITLSPAPNKRMKLFFDVWHNTTFGDAKMGEFRALWYAGDPNPYSIICENPPPSANRRYLKPLNTPDETIGSFWLGGVMKANDNLIQGNWGLQGDGERKVYIYTLSIQPGNQPRLINAGAKGTERTIQVVNR